MNQHDAIDPVKFEKAFNEWMDKLTDNGRLIINRKEPHVLTFRAGYEAAMAEMEKEVDAIKPQIAEWKEKAWMYDELSK